MLTERQVEGYRAQGFLVLRSFFSAETMAGAAREADEIRRSEIVHADNLRCRWQAHFDSGEAILDTLDPITDLAPRIAEIARAADLGEVLADLLGEPAHLFKDKLIYKPPGAMGHAPHQDYISWPSFPKSFTTVLVAIDDANRKNGCLDVFRGHHVKGYLSPRDGDYHDLPVSLFGEESRVPLELARGDIAIFGCFLPHGSAPNRSGSERRHLYLSYNGSSDGGDRRSKHYEEFHGWLKRRYAEYGCHQFYYR